MKELEAVWQITKVDYNSTGRKINLAELSWRLSGDGRFTAQGGVWNAKQTDYITCGQMVDKVAEFFPHSQLIIEIFDVWKEWHLKVVTDDSVLKQIKSWKKRADNSFNTYAEFQDYFRSWGKEDTRGIKVEQTTRGYSLLTYPESGLVGSVLVPLPTEKKYAKRAIERMQQDVDNFENYGITDDD